MACRTWPQSGWPPAPPGCGRRTPAWTPGSADQVLLRTPGSGWPGDGHGGPLERPVGRTRQFNVTVQPMGTDPVRTAAAKRRTPPAPSVRPCVWPAGHGQPRGVHVLALTGQDRTGQDGNAHAPFGQPQQLPASGPVRRDHLHPMLDAGTSASPVPVRCPRGRVRRPRWTPRSDRLPDAACPVVSGRTPSTPPGTPWQTGSDADREQTNGTEGTRTSSIATTTRRPAGTRRALSCGAGVCGLATKVGSAMATLPARPLPRQ
jgi:hypothetical protein